MSDTGDVTRYWVAVVATNSADVVRLAGGLLCDRALSGWDIRVFTDQTDVRALQILGAVPATSSQLATGKHPGTLAVCASLYASDAGIRPAVAEALACPHVEVVLLGQNPAAGECTLFRPARYQPSVAARAFKAAALAAIGDFPDPHPSPEMFGISMRAEQLPSVKGRDLAEFF